MSPQLSKRQTIAAVFLMFWFVVLSERGLVPATFGGLPVVKTPPSAPRAIVLPVEAEEAAVAARAIPVEAEEAASVARAEKIEAAQNPARKKAAVSALLIALAFIPWTQLGLAATLCFIGFAWPKVPGESSKGTAELHIFGNKLKIAGSVRWAVVIGGIALALVSAFQGERRYKNHADAEKAASEAALSPDEIVRQKERELEQARLQARRMNARKKLFENDKIEADRRLKQAPGTVAGSLTAPVNLEGTEQGATNAETLLQVFTHPND
jgi:hypothetical protein